MDCTPAYTVWRMAEDIFAAIGIVSIFAVLCLSAAHLVAKLLDAASVDLS